MSNLPIPKGFSPATGPASGETVPVATSVADLAGALGRPVSVALKRSPDCRLLLERAGSPWYRTMRLFRQPVSGEWNDVFEAISAAVARRLGERNVAP